MYLDDFLIAKQHLNSVGSNLTQFYFYEKLALKDEMMEKMWYNGIDVQVPVQMVNEGEVVVEGIQIFNDDERPFTGIYN